MSLGRAAVVVVVLGARPESGGAKLQDPAWRYTAAQLGCGVFHEATRTHIRGESGRAAIEDRAGRDAVIGLAATAAAGGLAVEAWFDSLVVWRETSGGREEPDAEGLLGGRFRGTLSATGEYRRLKVPFVPDEVAQVADVSAFFDEFFPRLPGAPLGVGKTWSDSTGLTVRRLADGRGGVRRLEWTWDRRTTNREEVDDTLAVTVVQLIKERGQLTWSDQVGPLSWTRQVVITARIPGTGGVRRPLTSTVTQDVAVSRRVESEPCHSPR